MVNMKTYNKIGPFIDLSWRKTSDADETLEVMGAWDEDIRIPDFAWYVSKWNSQVLTRGIHTSTSQYTNNCCVVEIVLLDPDRFRLARDTSFGHRHLNSWSKSPTLTWIVRIITLSSWGEVDDNDNSLITTTKRKRAITLDQLNMG